MMRRDDIGPGGVHDSRAHGSHPGELLFGRHGTIPANISTFMLNISQYRATVPLWTHQS
jgi:hypothetical protein